MLSDNVVQLPVVTRLDIPVERVLNNAPRDLQSVIVIGYTADGNFYFCSSRASGPDVLWDLHVAAKRLLEVEV